MNKYPCLAGVDYESMVDGYGVRMSVFLSGCRHHCPNCQNAATWNPEYGTDVTDELIQEIAEEYRKRPFLRGITLTGGDPFYDPAKTKSFLFALIDAIGQIEKPLDLWIYTGYTFEELHDMNDPTVDAILMQASVLVDGRFEQDKADKTLLFRGSSNQRLIDVQATYNLNQVILLEEH